MLLLFNLFGYKLVVNYLQQHADRQQEARIDLKDYEESQLIEIRVNLNIPYQTTRADFERCYGEIEINGKYYTYVKRKIQDGQLILKCLPNTNKEILKSNEAILFKASHGIDQDNSKTSLPHVKVFKSLLDDYVANKTSFQLQALNVFNKTYLITKISIPLHGFKSSTEQPPDLAFFI